ncbi:hypothetical protein IL54_0225 [Sphingobium sp. ba1]|nr:hypothetical protein IL54_0225 [Sphingobium sp. ba1]
MADGFHERKAVLSIYDPLFIGPVHHDQFWHARSY